MELGEKFNFDVWLEDVHRIFGEQPLYMLLKVELRKDEKGVLRRFVGLEGASPQADSLAFMDNLRDKKNPLAY